jgi:hypothetical protein
MWLPMVKQATTSGDVVTKIVRKPITTQYVVVNNFETSNHGSRASSKWLCEVWDKQPHRVMWLCKVLDKQPRKPITTL